MNSEEIRKPVRNYEKAYEISNFGNVRSLDRLCNDGRIHYGVPLKSQMDRKGYLYVILSKDGKSKHHKIHRLVADAFIYNKDYKPQVNHKNEIKTDNHVSNLEWCTNKENTNYGTRTERMAKKRSKPVKAVNIKTGLVHFFESTMDAQRKKGFIASNVGKCCNGKLKTHHGYRFEYI